LTIVFVIGLAITPSKNGIFMRDRKLEILVVVASILFVAHAADHVARDLHWPLTAEAIPFLATTAAILTIFSARFILFVAASWARGSGRYRSTFAGWLAVGTLGALMLTLIAITLYAGVLWGQEPGKMGQPLEK
jgi:hypothetical protein